MSCSFSADEFSRIQRSARRVEYDAAAHERLVDALVVAAERDVDLARSTALHPTDVSRVCVDRFAFDAQAQLHRSLIALGNLQRLCAEVHDQRRTTDQLIAKLRCHDDETGRPVTAARPAVLVVDDYEDGRNLVCAVLAGAGFVVRAASNGLEALLTAYEMRPAVIVMDVTMPILDGVEATRLIKSIDEIRDARVIAYTGLPATIDELAASLFVAILPKPASPAEVLATVRQHVAA